MNVHPDTQPNNSYLSNSDSKPTSYVKDLSEKLSILRK